jgi:hypothetical protein
LDCGFQTTSGKKILKFLTNIGYVKWLDCGFQTTSGKKILKFLTNIGYVKWLDCDFQTSIEKILRFFANRLCGWLDCGFYLWFSSMRIGKHFKWVFRVAIP